MKKRNGSMEKGELKKQLNSRLEVLENLLGEAEGKVAEFYELQLRVSSLQEDVKSLCQQSSKEVHAFEDIIGALSAPEKINDEFRLRSLKRRSAELATIIPKTGSLFIRLMLGKVNVRVFSPNDRQLLRDEFTKFKTRTTYAYIMLPLLSLLVQHYIGEYLADSHWSLVLIQIWLMYYYLTLAIRCNILKMNGSKMMDWWIYHHYISIFMTAVYLTWPNANVYNKYKKQYLLYLSFQGFVQFLQNHYQRARHYTLRALGRAGSMDVPMTETITETPGMVLIALIYANQFVQMFLGFSLLYTLHVDLDLFQPIANYREEMQALTLGVCLLILGTGNFVATSITLIKKKSNDKRE